MLKGQEKPHGTLMVHPYRIPAANGNPLFVFSFVFVVRLPNLPCSRLFFLKKIDAAIAHMTDMFILGSGGGHLLTKLWDLHNVFFMSC